MLGLGRKGGALRAAAGVGEHVAKLVVVPGSAHLAEATLAVQVGKHGKRELAARREHDRSVEVVPAAGDMHLTAGGAFTGDHPRAAPGELAAPDLAVVLGGRAIRVKREERLVLVARRSATALKDVLVASKDSALELGLAAPAAVEEAESPTGPLGEPPVGRVGPAHHDLAAVLWDDEASPTLEDVGVVKDPVESSTRSG